MKVIRSFKYALAGIAAAFKTQLNLRIEILAAFIVVIAGLYFNITDNQWLIIILNIAFVLAAELFNTAVEKLCDLTTRENNPDIKFIKDISAAAVLAAATSAVVSAFIIFLPKINS
jgi:diacylglycerol kinase